MFCLPKTAWPSDLPAKPKQPKEEGEDELKPPFELGSKSDYQLAQALNLLKGLQIIQNNK